MVERKKICVPSCDQAREQRDAVADLRRTPKPRAARQQQTPFSTREDFRIGIARADIPGLRIDTLCCEWQPGRGYVTVIDRGASTGEFCGAATPPDPDNPPDGVFESPPGSANWLEPCAPGVDPTECSTIGAEECWRGRAATRCPYRVVNFGCPIKAGEVVWLHREFGSGRWVVRSILDDNMILKITDDVTAGTNTTPGTGTGVRQQVDADGVYEDVTLPDGSAWEVDVLNSCGEITASTPFSLIHVKRAECKWWVDVECCPVTP